MIGCVLCIVGRWEHALVKPWETVWFITRAQCIVNLAAAISWFNLVGCPLVTRDAE